MPRKSVVTSSSKRRVFSQEFKQEAVQMLLDGHTPSSIVERLGISGTNLLYRWKNQQLASSGLAIGARYHGTFTNWESMD
jgi:transposase-like protein